MASNGVLPQIGNPVTVSLDDLKAGTIPHEKLREAFGPTSLGILVVTGLPGHFADLRSRVLSNSSRLAALPARTLAQLTNPAAKYLTGWSHGVETLRPGVVDTQKGSYYINCAFYVDPALQAAADAAHKFPGFEEYTAPNRWPSEVDIPGFKASAQLLIALIIDVAVLVARACDQFAATEVPGYPDGGYLEAVVKGSTTTKARLLHYFPVEGRAKLKEETPASAAATTGTDDDDDWCATHVDHGCLTGLTSAMFVDEGAADNAAALSPPSPSPSPSTPEPAAGAAAAPLTELPKSPSPLSGLYIRSRSGSTVKVNIPRDSLAFQTGEALERITQGRFKAVPHFVRGAASEGKIARNTLAVFTQPNLDELVDLDQRITFGEFARGVVSRNTAVV